MLHMTSKSSGYLENVWAWVADHELDGGPSQTQIDIYVARGSAELTHVVLFQANVLRQES